LYSGSYLGSLLSGCTATAHPTNEKGPQGTQFGGRGREREPHPIRLLFLPQGVEIENRLRLRPGGRRVAPKHQSDGARRTSLPIAANSRRPRVPHFPLRPALTFRKLWSHRWGHSPLCPHTSRSPPGDPHPALGSAPNANARYKCEQATWSKAAATSSAGKLTYAARFDTYCEMELE
jgi:hypothetical protein